MNWLQKIAQPNEEDEGESFDEPVGLNEVEDEGFVEDESGRVFWGSQGSGLLFVRNHPQLGPQLLVVLRSESVEEPDTWGTSGGAVPPETDAFTSAVRESKEELGSLPTKHRRLGQYVWRQPNGSFTYTTFIIEVLDNWEPTNFNWEVNAAKWVSLKEAALFDLHFGLTDLLDSLGPAIYRAGHCQSNWLRLAGYYGDQRGYWLALWVDTEGNIYDIDTTHQDWAWSNRDMLLADYDIDLDAWYAQRQEEETANSYDELRKDKIRAIAHMQEIDESQVTLSEEDEEQLSEWASESADSGIKFGVEVVDQLIQHGWIRVAQKSAIHLEGDEQQSDFIIRCENILRERFKDVWTNPHYRIVINAQEIRSTDLQRTDSLAEALRLNARVSGYYMWQR